MAAPSTLSVDVKYAVDAMRRLVSALRGPVALHGNDAFDWLCSHGERGVPYEITLKMTRDLDRTYERCYIVDTDRDPVRVNVLDAVTGEEGWLAPGRVVELRRSDGEPLRSLLVHVDDDDPDWERCCDQDGLHLHDQLEYPRCFALVRDEDETGISGVGQVAWGVQFPDGKCVTRWKGDSTAVRQTCVWDSLADVERIHGHRGKTRIVWEDGQDPFPDVAPRTTRLKSGVLLTDSMFR